MTSLVVTCLEGVLIAGVYPRKITMKHPEKFGDPVATSVEPLAPDALPAQAFILGRNEAKPMMVTLDRSLRLTSPSEAKFQVKLLSSKDRVRISVGNFKDGLKEVQQELGHVPECGTATVDHWFLLEAPLA